MIQYSFYEIVLMLVLLNAFYIQGQAYIKPAITGLEIESLIIGVMILAIGFLEPNLYLIEFGFLVIVLRAIAITHMLNKSLKFIPELKRESLKGVASSLIIDLFMTMFVLIIFQFFFISYLELNNALLLFAAALFFQGLFLIASRRNTHIQIIGYVEEENALVLFGLFIISLPLLIEASVLLDVIGLVIISTVVIIEKEEHFPMEELRG
jgi:Hydrogenase 4 membrane component (E)